MAKKKRRTIASLSAEVSDLTARLDAITDKWGTIDSGAAALADSLTKAIRDIVEAEVDDLLADLRIER